MHRVCDRKKVAILQVLQTRALRQAYKQDIAVLRARRLELGNRLQVGTAVLQPSARNGMTRITLFPDLTDLLADHATSLCHRLQSAFDNVMHRLIHLLAQLKHRHGCSVAEDRDRRRCGQTKCSSQSDAHPSAAVPQPS